METEKQILSSVAKLKIALNKLIELKASNIEDLIVQREPKVLVDPKDWEEGLKLIDKMATFEAFDKIVKADNVEHLPEANGNPFEERSKLVKQKLNGKTPN